MSTIIEKIKTFEDACKELNLNPKDFTITIPNEFSKHSEALTAHLKLVVITQALNEGWEPDWSNWDEYKYYPWFDMEDSASGGFSFGGYGDWNSISIVGSRLCFKSRELAEYAGKQFEGLYETYFVIKK
ncbi:hypothetical protein ETU09_00610 [Apibacter muscae]|uniref:Uncharacterized protein n=1 Tax=Apibacter muscae TaxID=2509004 RepID=A0A563DK03_9FLAO|nr:hypothetical protein [Apibacter muscae]TWP30535.1 hypothetical protein ETU09_00610 [Apibacter muscae]